MTEMNSPGHAVEEWRPVPTLQHIEASSLGRVRYVGPKRRRIDTGHVLRQHSDKDGYKLTGVPLLDGSSRRTKTMRVHRLVALAFHGLPPEWAELVEHRDDCKTNNTPGNLFWSTHKANLNRTGFITMQRAREVKRGENNPFYGRQHSLEARARISAGLTGIRRSAETRAKISAAKREAAARRRLQSVPTPEAGSARHA